jgi:serine/threonine protein kinase
MGPLLRLHVSDAFPWDYNKAQLMGLTSGTKLGPYEIVSPLGAGGMGEVYRACDMRLDRTVAVKILPEHLSSSAEARQRFDREARAISALSHPNICYLYDVGQQEGTSYIVSESVSNSPELFRRNSRQHRLQFRYDGAGDPYWEVTRVRHCGRA